jgi:hypothetical protein
MIFFGVRPYICRRNRVVLKRDGVNHRPHQNYYTFTTVSVLGFLKSSTQFLQIDIKSGC